MARQREGKGEVLLGNESPAPRKCSAVIKVSWRLLTAGTVFTGIQGRPAADVQVAGSAGVVTSCCCRMLFLKGTGNLLKWVAVISQDRTLHWGYRKVAAACTEW